MITAADFWKNDSFAEYVLQKTAAFIEYLVEHIMLTFLCQKQEIQVCIVYSFLQ